jgi:hypothetical protein
LTGRARPPSPGICTLPTPSARLADQQPCQNGPDWGSLVREAAFEGG